MGIVVRYLVLFQQESRTMTVTSHTLTRTIVEVPHVTGRHWLCKETGRKYRSAAGAAAAIRRETKRIKRDVIITRLTWEPATPLGSMVVDALRVDEEAQS